MGAYFRVPAATPMQTYNGWVIRLRNNLRTLEQSVAGRDLTIHSAIGQHAGMEDAAAYVRRNDPVGMLREQMGWSNPLVPAGFCGDIYMDFNQLGATHVAAANLVHEASHRYLGTRDWSHLPNYDMVAYERQWAALGLPIPYPPRSRNALKAWANLTVDEALNNADSYGGFVSRLTIPL